MYISTRMLLQVAKPPTQSSIKNQMNLLVHVTVKSHDQVQLAQQLQDGWKGLVSSLLPWLSALLQVCLLVVARWLSAEVWVPLLELNLINVMEDPL